MTGPGTWGNNWVGVGRGGRLGDSNASQGPGPSILEGDMSLQQSVSPAGSQLLLP